MAVKSYKELVVWQKAMDFVEHVYKASETFPDRERYGLTIQLRRAAVSVPSNIAEGQGRNSTRDFLHFLSIANGSLCEAETQILLAQRLGLLDNDTTTKLIELAAEVGRINNGLRKSLTADH